MPTEVVILERVGSDGNTFHQLPFALTPGPPIPTTALRESIESTAAAVAAGLPRLPRTAVFDILLRRAPRTRSGAPLPRGTDTVADITAAALDLDSSYLAVHGPPGTGKTHTAARVISRLVTDHGWRIGVVAQSHATVENLLDCVIDAGLDPARVAKKRYDARRSALAGDRRQRVRGIHRRQRRLRDRRHGMGFRQRQPGTAGQPGPAGDRRGGPVLPGQHHRRGAGGRQPACCSATLSSCRRSARARIPNRSTRQRWTGWSTVSAPCPTNAATSWTCSYRMHPAVCAAVSALSYEGRLHSHTECTAARRLDGYQPGVHVVTVRHQGNSTESPEEADAIAAQIERLLGTAWTDEHGTRPLAASDVLVLAPYNAQVALMRQRLTAAGLGEVRVGNRRQVPGRAGAGGLRLDDGLVRRRRAARNLVPAQQESAQRRHQPGTVRGGDRALAVADRVPAGHARGPDRPGRFPGADAARPRIYLPDECRP